MSYRKVLEDFRNIFVDNPKDNRWLYGWEKYKYRTGNARCIIGLYLDKLSKEQLSDIQGQDIPIIYEKIKGHLPVDNMSFWYHLQVLHDDVHTNFSYFCAFATQYDLREKLFDGQYNDLGYTYNWNSTTESKGLPLFTDDGKRRFNWIIDKFCPELQELKFSNLADFGHWQQQGRWYTMIRYRSGIPTGVS